MLVCALDRIGAVGPLPEFDGAEGNARVYSLQLHDVCQHHRLLLGLAVFYRDVPDILVKKVAQFLPELYQVVFHTILEFLEKHQGLVFGAVLSDVDKSHHKHLVDILEVLDRNVGQAIDDILHHTSVFLLNFLQNVQRLFLLQLLVECVDDLKIFLHHPGFEPLDVASDFADPAEVGTALV